MKNVPKKAQESGNRGEALLGLAVGIPVLLCIIAYIFMGAGYLTQSESVRNIGILLL